LAKARRSGGFVIRILQGDCRAVLATLPAESAHCVVTSPPYWGLRDYGIPPTIWDGDPACEHEWGDETTIRKSGGKGSSGLMNDGRSESGRTTADHANAVSHIDASQGAFCRRCNAWRGAFGLEPTIDLYVEHAVEVFRAVRRVLRKDGTLWLNLGDSYAAQGGPGWQGKNGQRADRRFTLVRDTVPMREASRSGAKGLKPKDLCGIPWRVAFALQADGWWLRQDIIWSKPNPMPESVTDRCTKAHEYLFLLSKSASYFYDAEAIKEQAIAENEHDLTGPGMFAPGQTPQRGNRKIKMPDGWDTGPGGHGSYHRQGREKGRTSGNKTHKSVSEYEASESEEHRTKAGLLKISETAYAARNKRSVWTVATSPFPDAHFATFPPALIEPCILAGCPKGGTVLDPFFGAGTTGLVCDRLGRDCIGIELNENYAAMAERRIADDAGLFAEVGRGG
jgi:DNA modification methylase